jgi:hypothetical protein
MKKKDSYYFPHFINARNDRKVLKLRMSVGIQGYAIFLMLLEVLREQSEMKYPLSSLPELKFDFRVPQKLILKVITEFELFSIDEQDNFFSQNLIDYMQPYKEKSERARLAARKKWDAFGDAKGYTNASPNADARNEVEGISKEINEVEESPTSSDYFKKEISNNFLLDVGLLNTWIDKGYPKESYSHGIQTFINQALKPKLMYQRNNDSGRKHFINWMKDYSKAARKAENNNINGQPVFKFQSK